MPPFSFAAFSHLPSFDRLSTDFSAGLLGSLFGVSFRDGGGELFGSLFGSLFGESLRGGGLLRGVEGSLRCCLTCCSTRGVGVSDRGGFTGSDFGTSWRRPPP